MSHLTDEQIARLKQNRADTDEKIEFLTHLGECEFCENRFIEACEENKIRLAKTVKDSLIGKFAGINIIKRKKIEFRNYCIRVALCVGCAVVMIMTFNFSVVTKAKAYEEKKQEPSIIRFSNMIDDIKEFFTFKED